MSSKVKLNAEPFEPLKVDYNQVVRSVLVPLKEEPKMDRKFLSAIALEFYAAVKKAEIPLEQHYLAELLIRTMVDANEMEKLKQCLQYSVVDDSKFLAFELITLSKEKPEFGQLALDMLKRKPNNREQVAEFYINRGEIIDALRMLRGTPIDKTLSLRLLEEAWKSNDRKLKYMVFTHLRDVRKLGWLDGSSPDDQFDSYIREFKQLFNLEELEEADQRSRLAKISSVASLPGLNPSPSRNILIPSHDYLNDSIPSSYQSDFDMNNAPGAGIPNY
uniref:Mic1 domain-containing protein n=2 Tax=Bursaphelenchus xylophilus TaxID=6326 RepID=A0A1I7SHA6_BURXY